jgi:hypothetical protein
MGHLAQQHQNVRSTKPKPTLLAPLAVLPPPIAMPSNQVFVVTKPKNNNRQSSVSPINDLGQQRLNGTADWSATEGGQVMPHFEHIASGR